MADKKSYKKKKLDVTFGGGIYDDEYVTTPRASMGVGKGDKKLDFTFEKPFSKKTKENISSQIGLGYTKEGENSSFNVTGTKRGKSKNLSFNYSRSFSTGGYTGSYIKSELDGKKVSNKSYEEYYKGMIDV